MDYFRYIVSLPFRFIAALAAAILYLLAFAASCICWFFCDMRPIEIVDAGYTVIYFIMTGGSNLFK